MLRDSRGSRYDWFGALGAGALVVLFCFLLLWHDPLVFWNDDYELSILPVFRDVARSWSEGHLPLLSPYSWVCGNLAGEFQYGTFSVFVNAVVVLIWKFPLVFAQQAAALSIVHLFVLAMGAYMLARGRNLAPPLATMVALVTALNGWIICWGASDWFGALGAFAWLPWAWWGTERALEPARGRWRFIWPAPFVYLLITGGFPYTVLMFALVAAWLAIREIVQRQTVTAIWPLVFGILLGVGIAAPAWLALLDYVHGSAREAQDPAAHWQWRVPLSALPGFIFPNWTVRWTDFSTRLLPHTATEMACGLVPSVALIAALITSARTFVRQIKWELALLVIVILLSMVPTAGVFRWSFRWLPLVHIVLALCAAEALRLNSRQRFVEIALLVSAALTMLFFASGKFTYPLTWILIVLGVIWLIVDSTARLWVAPVVTFAALLATYLCIPPNCGVPKYNLSQRLNNPAPLDPARLYLSIYPFPEVAYRSDNQPGPIGQIVRPGSTSMFAGLRFVTGYSPIRPAGVARAYAPGIHGQIDYLTAVRLLRNECGPAGELAQLGVDGVIVARAFPLRPEPESEWSIAYSSDEGTVYHRNGDPIGPVQTGVQVHVLENSRNRVRLTTSEAPASPAPVIFSRPFFRGYVATINGARLPVQTFRGLAPMIGLPAGTSGNLELVYRPGWLIYGSVAAIVCAAIWLTGVAAPVVSGRPQ